jgi:hypothetical protein
MEDTGTFEANMVKTAQSPLALPFDFRRAQDELVGQLWRDHAQ